MVHKIDGIPYRLKECHDFSWLKKYGKTFFINDQTGSGCICIGIENENGRLFYKIAGVNTMEAEVSPLESVDILKHAVDIYYDLQHPHLTRICDAFSYQEFYVAVFAWADGECLFDHWNFDKYAKQPLLKSPKERFFNLPKEKKLAAIDVLFSFLKLTARKGYVAVDFYDGSIIYDFEKDALTICDIDLFRKCPTVNNIGIEWFGTKRLKAPEEYEYGSSIDEITNVFTLGALIFDFFGHFSKQEISKRYEKNQFVPCTVHNWTLNNQSYAVAAQAVNPDRQKRFLNIEEFYTAWKAATAES